MREREIGERARREGGRGEVEKGREGEDDTPISMALHLFKFYWTFGYDLVRFVGEREGKGGEWERWREERKERVPCILYFSSCLSV